MITIVQAITTDQSWSATSGVYTFSTELAVRLHTFGTTVSGEAGIVRVAHLSDELFDIALAHVGVAVPLHRWAGSEFVGTACHLHYSLGDCFLVLVEEHIVSESIDVDVHGDVVVSVVVEDLGRDH